MDLTKYLRDLASDLERFRAGEIDRLFLRETSRATHVLVRGVAVLCAEAQLRANGVHLIADQSTAKRLAA